MTMTRDTDLQDPHNLELGHVYERLKKLEEGQGEVQKTLHAVQLKLAEGPRFPNYVPVLMASILLFLAGQVIIGLIWGGGINAEVSNLQGTLSLCEKCPVIEERVKNLEGRVVGNTADGWRRRDHELYAEAINRRFEALEVKLGAKK